MAEENHLEKIGEIIKSLSAESSFSADAMRQFMELKDEVDLQGRRITYLRGELKERDTKITDMTSEIEGRDAHIAELNDEVVGWTTQSNELEAREKNIQRLEIEAECHKARVSDHQAMVTLIFRNTELKTRVLGQEVMMEPGTPDGLDQFGNRVWGSGQPPQVVGAPIEKVSTEAAE